MKRITIALFHFHVTQIKRSAGQSAVAAAAYRSGEKLHSEYYGEDSDYTRKGGGQFELTFDVIGPLTAPKESKYYGENYPGGGSDKHVGELVIMRIEQDAEGNDYYTTIESEDELNEVFEKYCELAEADEEE